MSDPIEQIFREVAMMKPDEPPRCDAEETRDFRCEASATHLVHQIHTGRQWKMCERHAAQRIGSPYLVKIMSVTPPPKNP